MLNKVYRFNYSGGSDPNALRLVFLTGGNDRYLSGYDFDRKGFRSFSRDKLTNLEEVFAQVVVVDSLPDKVDVGELNADYRDDDYLTFENDAWLVAVKDNRVEPEPEPEETILISYSSANGTIVIEVDDDKPAIIKTYNADNALLSNTNRLLRSAGEIIRTILA